MTRVDLHYKGFVELRNSPGVVADIKRRAAAVERAAEGEAEAPYTHRGRMGRTNVGVSGDYEKLVRALDAGRL